MSQPDLSSAESAGSAAGTVPEPSWQALQSLFHRAAELPAEQRAAFLDQACADAPELRAGVEPLLALDTDSRWLRGGVEQAASELAAADGWLGHQLGPYRFLRRLGKGGMGAVYLAERCDGEYRQRVAIKVVARGSPAGALRQRFLVERQILARMQHPNIVRFLGGGTERGIPYLVMEWVDGETLGEYCARHELGIGARLQLFHQVLEAVSYVHRNSVVHRDLKPSNILVSETGGVAAGAPTVKLLDFGIAEQLDDADDQGSTLLGQRPMTPEYASPEQRSGLAVTTASDVYSLGIVLYELLCGRRPSAATRPPLHAVGVVPPPPSQVARPNAARLRGDLDHIVLRAMALDPGDRYSSAVELAADLRRHACHLPVAARSRSAG
ncbi:MAG: serine/threonine protein kinase [Holophagales bacterium]|nr:serine/threonine protein kinase [Holophagales bacterium]